MLRVLFDNQVRRLSSFRAFGGAAPLKHDLRAAGGGLDAGFRVIRDAAPLKHAVPDAAGRAGDARFRVICDAALLKQLIECAWAKVSCRFRVLSDAAPLKLLLRRQPRAEHGVSASFVTRLH